MKAYRKSLIASAGAAVMMSIVLSELASGEARATTFTFEPTTTAEVGAGFNGPFNGNGDAVFPGNFDTVVNSSTEANSEVAEFNLSGFSIPQQENITSATYQVNAYDIGPNLVFPPGFPPQNLVVRGFFGNGAIETYAFQAGTILDTVNVQMTPREQTFNFNVTPFVKDFVGNGGEFIGFGIRAQDDGGLVLERPSTGLGPKLTITTSPVPEPSSFLGILAFGALGASRALKRNM